MNPIDVSTERPPSTAATEAPAPRWQQITRSRSGGRPSSSAARPRGVGVREPVEAEAAERVPVAPLARQGVGRRGGRHVAVECRVEARHRRHVRKHGGHGGHRVEGGRLVQRRQRCELAQGLEDGGIEAHRPGEPRAAVDHTVRDRVGAAQAVERLAELLGIGPPRRGGQLGVPEERVVVAEEAQLERARAGVDREDPHGPC